MSQITISPELRTLADSRRAARVKYQGNVLYCAQHRTFGENLAACMAALVFLTGEPEDAMSDQLIVEAYRSS